MQGREGEAVDEEGDGEDGELQRDQEQRDAEEVVRQVEAVLEEEQQKVKKKFTHYVLKEDMVTEEKGPKSLYQNVKSARLDLSDEMDETRNLQKYVRYIQDWHFQVMPKYAMEYFLDRLHVLSKKPMLKGYLSRMRNIHVGNYQWEDMDKDDDALRQMVYQQD